MTQRPLYILPVIVFAQFTGTSLWFAGNAVLPDLQMYWNEAGNITGWITSAVQLGFIAGTLIFALFALADKFHSSKVFLLCSVGGAITTLSMIWFKEAPFLILTSRVLTGFFLAGVYPVGMKIAAGWYQKGLGKAIGWLVGALVIGTAFPSFIRGIGANLDWKITIITVAALAVTGGLLMFFLINEGPYIKKGSDFKLSSFLQPFKSKAFRSAAFGYFGHMWELYAFWAFIPVYLTAYALFHNESFNVLFITSFIIGAGSIGCIAGGYISEKTGSARVAFFLLSASGLCCLLSPLLFMMPVYIFVPFLIWWGIVIVGDSPQFSAINARTAPQGLVGTGLTAAVCIGFAITIVSISLLDFITGIIQVKYIFLFLLPGPIIGLFSMKYLLSQKLN